MLVHGRMRLPCQQLHSCCHGSQPALFACAQPPTPPAVLNALHPRVCEQSKVGNKWSEVAKHIPGRTGQQCAQRWRHKVNPAIRRDKWSAEEDAQLIDLVKTFGIGRWAEIARHCDGRTDQQCMGRWRRHLDPSIRRVRVPACLSFHATPHPA